MSQSGIIPAPRTARTGRPAPAPLPLVRELDDEQRERLGVAGDPRGAGVHRVETHVADQFTGHTLGVLLAGLPWGVLYLIAVPMAAWQEGARQAVFLLAAALSASIFWSLQTLVYLHLRLAIDGVDAREVAVRPLPEERPEAPLPERKAADQLADWRRSRRAAPFSARRAVRATVTVFAAAVGSWCLTFWLVNRACGGQAGWLGWGLSDTFLPPAEGVYRVASVIAGLWGVAWLALPFVWVARRLRSGGVPQDKGIHQPNGD